MIGQTPGPWAVDVDATYHPKGQIPVYSEDDWLIAYVMDDVDDIDGRANALLIASAPTLLEENKRLKRQCDEVQLIASSRLNAAIAKGQLLQEMGDENQRLRNALRKVDLYLEGVKEWSQIVIEESIRMARKEIKYALAHEE